MVELTTASAKWLLPMVIVLSLAFPAAAQDPSATDAKGVDVPAEATAVTDEGALPTGAEKPAEGEKPGAQAQPEVDLTPDPPGLTRLAKDSPLWIDLKRKLVVLDGEVVLREGTLEMFACPKGTKEHESVIVVQCKPHFVHTALLALGLKPGSGVRFDPMYVPAKGPVIDIFVIWKDTEGKEQRVRAQEWIKSLKTEKEMELDWVFAGSGFWKDEDTGESHYQADGGDFICVSNFPTAMLDLPVASSQSNDALSFTAFTERIPARGTKVRLVLRPRNVEAPAATESSPPAAEGKQPEGEKEKKTDAAE